ncbi:MAG: T9SS type A sorting domain-containing protein [Prolixibacteraceae bacterium]
MKKNFTLLKGLILTVLCFVLSLSMQAQNLVEFGDMPEGAEEFWTVGHRGGDLPVVTFGVEEDVPTNALSSTAASIPWGTGWAETQLWQVVSLKGGVTYTLDAMLKGTFQANSTWVQGFLMPWLEPDNEEGANSWKDASISQAVNLLQVNEWTEEEEILELDGEFPKNVAPHDKFLHGEDVTPEEDGDWVVLFKMGGNQAEVSTINLTDVVVSDGAGTGVNLLDNTVVKVYPTNASDYINVVGFKQAVNIKISDVSGRTVKSLNNYSAQQINISDLNKGLFIVEVEENNSVSTSKFFKN